MRKHSTAAVRRTCLLLLATLGAACGDAPPPAVEDVAPRPRDVGALHRSMDRHYPAGLRAAGRAGAVLLDIHVDAAGAVRDVDVVTPPSESAEMQMVLVDEDPRTGKVTERRHRPVYDPAFGPAARAALLETRFTPAVRNGRPVAETLRMSVEFGPAPRG